MSNEAAVPSGGAERLTIAGVRLEIGRHKGRRSKPTLVFLHEGLGCVAMWRTFPAQLASLTSCPALVYSRQGYGYSDPCPLPRPLRYMHDEGLEVLPEVLAAAGVDDHVLIGHSDGASIALINAGGNPAAGLRGVVTMAPHVFCEEISVSSIRKARDAFVDRDLRKRLSKYHHDNTDCAFWGWCDAWLDADFLRWNIEEYLPGIRVPQLVIQGKDDPYGTVGQIDAIVSQSGGSVGVALLEQCGHAPHIKQATQSLEAIGRFVASVAVASGPHGL
jgi:pimeloyl-ACP methyl ester carboxylesterase